MNRKYDKEKYLSLVEKLKQEIPDLSLTTDIIVGFPGETEEDFLETMDVVERADYDTAFTFIYSKRSGTPAASKPDQVPEDVVKDRFDRLLKLVQTRGHIRSSRFLGTTQEVLIEDESRDAGILTGRTEHNLLVHFPGSRDQIGTFAQVKLTESHGFYYFGEVVES
jgi:tRNA-2-methylthio-N6-dimethylallyladenosine synthase